MSNARNIARLLASNTGVVDPTAIPSLSGSVLTGTIPKSRMPSGSVLQIKNTLYQSYNSMTIDNGWYDIPSMNVTITPIGVNSKFRIDVRWFGEVVSAWDCVFGIMRNGNLINMPTQEGTRFGAIAMPLQSYIDDNNDSTPEYVCFSTIDYPYTTSQLTYKLVIKAWSSRTLWNGRVFSSSATGPYEQGSMEITVTEYAA
jgi:hypothetical protein